MRKNLLNRILKICFSVVSFTILPLLAVWHICYGLTAGYPLFAVWIVLTFLIVTARWRVALNAFLFGAVCYVLTLYASLMQYNSRTAEMCARIDDGNRLSIQEKIGVYGLNILMGLAGYSVFPEASAETLLLCIPTENRRRIFQGDFFLKSKRIRRALKNGQTAVSWSLSDLTSFGPEARAGLALNPCTIHRTSDLVEVEVDVRYSRNFTVQLLGFIRIEEKLFWHLQEEGWLFPYQAVWQAPMTEL